MNQIQNNRRLLNIWYAAALGSRWRSKRLSKRELASLNLQEICAYLLDSEDPLALCITARLLLGLSKVLKQQSTFIYADVLQLWARLRRDMYILTSDTIDMANPKARSKNITLRENEDLKHIDEFLPLSQIVSNEQNPFKYLFDYVPGLTAPVSFSPVGGNQTVDDSYLRMEEQHLSIELLMPEAQLEPAAVATSLNMHIVSSSRQHPRPASGSKTVQEQNIDLPLELNGSSPENPAEEESSAMVPDLDVGPDTMFADIIDDHNMNMVGRRHLPRPFSNNAEYQGDVDQDIGNNQQLSYVLGVLSSQTEEQTALVPLSPISTVGDDLPPRRRRRNIAYSETTMLPASFYNNVAAITTTRSRRLNKKSLADRRVRVQTILYTPQIPAGVSSTHPMWQRNIGNDQRSSSRNLPREMTDTMPDLAELGRGGVELPRRRQSDESSRRSHDSLAQLLQNDDIQDADNASLSNIRDTSMSETSLLDFEDDRRSNSSKQRQLPMFAGRYRPLREEDEHLDNYDVDYDLGPDDGYLSFEVLGSGTGPAAISDLSESTLYTLEDFYNYARLLVTDNALHISFRELFPSVVNTLKSEVAQAFHHVLVLATEGRIRVSQGTSFGEIQLKFPA